MEGCASITRGLKRSLSDSDSSPEYLMQSEPVADPYSSNDTSEKDKQKKLYGKRKNNCEQTSTEDLKEPNTILFKKHNSSNMKAEHVHFFLNVKFEEMVEEIPLENADIETCLSFIFQFMSGKRLKEIKPDISFKYNMKNMTELKEFHLSEEYVNWLYENDDLSYNLASPKDIIRKRQFLRECHDLKYNVARTYALNTCNVYIELMTEQEKRKKQQKISSATSYTQNWIDLDKTSILMQSYLHTLAFVVNYTDYKQDGLCVNWFPLRVRPSDISEGSSLIEDRIVQILAMPDGVFTIPLKNSQSIKKLKPDDYLSKIVIQVYSEQNKNNVLRQNTPLGPHRLTTSSQSLSSLYSLAAVNSQEMSNVTEPKETPKQKIKLLEKPIKSGQDCIKDSEYCTNVRKYIKRGLPKQCRSSHLVDNIAGKHVMQLFSQAFHNKVTSKFSESDCHSHHANGDNFLRGVGIFVVDEYIYFSRLEVDSCLLGLINGLEYSGSLSNNENLNCSLDALYDRLEPPHIAYAPFRLQITVPSHRHALIIFLREYLYNYSLK